MTIARWTKEWVEAWNEGREYERKEVFKDVKYMLLQAAADTVIDKYIYKVLIDRIEYIEKMIG